MQNFLITLDLQKSNLIGKNYPGKLLRWTKQSIPTVGCGDITFSYKHSVKFAISVGKVRLFAIF